MTGNKFDTQTRPHSRTHGGLREHSVGELYPYMIVGFADDTWQVQDAQTGHWYGERTTFDEAEATATALKRITSGS